MEGLHAYLQRASENLRKLKASPNYASLHVVLGNEALDLDSAVASILFAYFLDATKANDSEVVIPVMSIPRQDWNLRTETKYLFSKKEIQISADMLIFMDDLPMEVCATDICWCIAGIILIFLPSFFSQLLDQVFESEKLRLSLVDHNVPTAALRKYNASFVSPHIPASTADSNVSACRIGNIIDHHEDFTSQLRLPDGSFPSLNIKEIVVVGSATTLIAERILVDAPALITGPVASMLIAPILIDTVNLDEKMNRVTPRDRYVRLN
jgi:exopolyphosphatase